MAGLKPQFFSGHTETEMERPDPGGGNLQYDLQGGGDERGVWGGKSAHRGQYTGGWTHDPNSPSVPQPTDWDQYNRETAFRPSAREEDVNRYRNMGAQLGSRSFAPLQYGGANSQFDLANKTLGQAIGQHSGAQAVRFKQQQASGLFEGAARGDAPSRAEILGRGLIDQSLKAQMAGAAGARGGPLAQMAAQRGVQQQAAGFQAQGMNQLSALRADEMERARSAWGQHLAGVRGQDYAGAQNLANIGGQFAGIGGQRAQMAQFQGDLDLRQQGLNQAGQLDYEKLGWDTNKAAADIGLGRSGLEQNAYQFGQSTDLAQQQINQQWVGAGIGGVSDSMGMAVNASQRNQNPHGNYVPSDMRAKRPAPLLLDLAGRKPSAAAPNFLSKWVDAGGLRKEHEQAREVHDERMDDMNAPNVYRDDPYDPGQTPGDIQREDPYGSGEVFFSDERAKREAYLLGRAHVTEQTITGKSVPYSYGGPIKKGEKVEERIGPAGRDPVSFQRHDPEKQQEAIQGYESARNMSGQALKSAAMGRPFGLMSNAAGAVESYAMADAAASEADGKVQRPPREGSTTGAKGLVVERGGQPSSAIGRDRPMTKDNLLVRPGWSGARIPAREQGGPVEKGQPYLVGEKRPEVMVPESDGYVYPSVADAVDAKQREGRRDPRSFVRDTPEDQVRTKRGYEDAAGREADSLIAALMDPSKRGASVSVDGGEADGGDLDEVQQDANRRMESFPYEYRDEYLPPEQSPGELNYGPSAQELEQNPITATAVKQDPQGMRMVDMPKLVKAQAGSIASLQRQLDELKGGYRYG